MSEQIGLNGSGHAPAAMLHVHLGCEFRYETAPGVEFVVLVEPAAVTPRARELRAKRSAEPGHQLRLYEDGFGNRCWRITSVGSSLNLRYDALFAVPDAPDEIDPTAPQLAMSQVPDDVLLYTLPSRYCQSDLLLDDAWTLFGDGPDGYGRVQAICDWVHGNVAYGYVNSGPSISAVDTFGSRQGVCRDFAHLPVAFCRALNIPARYVFGYLPDYAIEPDGTPMDFHAWFEAYLGGRGGGRWYTFDARHNVPRIGRVKIAHGRDAVDVAMVTSFGAARLESMTVWTEAERVDATVAGARGKD
jgi:transglutaminase-like putative cysteine protease